MKDDNVKYNINFLAVIFFVVFGFAKESMAATYYVAKDGSGTFSTIQAALNAAQSGETIIVKSGTYNELISFPRQGVVLKAMSGETVTIIQTGRVINCLIIILTFNYLLLYTRIH